MTWQVRAWRDNNGHVSIDVGTLYGGNDYNMVVDFSIGSEEELERFIGECRAAWKRASEATAPLFEEMPDPYANDWYEDTNKNIDISFGSRVIKQGDEYPLLDFDADLAEVARVRYVARLPNHCVVRGDLKVMDASVGMVELIPPSLPAGTQAEIEIVWADGTAETSPNGIEVIS